MTANYGIAMPPLIKHGQHKRWVSRSARADDEGATLDELIRQRNKGKELEEKLAQYAAARVDAEVAQLRSKDKGRSVRVRTGGWCIASSCPSATTSAVRPRCASLSH